MVILAGTKQSN